MSQLLRAEGRAMLAMWGLVIGNLLNILLDPFLIFTCSLGISGAAWAAVIGQWISFAFLLLIYVMKKSRIALLENVFHPNYRLIAPLFTAGMPSLMRQGLIFFATLLLNRTASQIGEYALSAMSITGRMFLFAFSFCAGVEQGMMSVVGYHCGAGNKEKMQKALQFALLTS
jgi:Na+-driven multidrug efflux pump